MRLVPGFFIIPYLQNRQAEPVSLKGVRDGRRAAVYLIAGHRVLAAFADLLDPAVGKQVSVFAMDRQVLDCQRPCVIVFGSCEFYILIIRFFVRQFDSCVFIYRLIVRQQRYGHGRVSALSCRVAVVVPDLDDRSFRQRLVLHITAHGSFLFVRCQGYDTGCRVSVQAGQGIARTVPYDLMLGRYRELDVCDRFISFRCLGLLQDIVTVIQPFRAERRGFAFFIRCSRQIDFFFLTVDDLIQLELCTFQCFAVFIHLIEGHSIGKDDHGVAFRRFFHLVRFIRVIAVGKSYSVRVSGASKLSGFVQGRFVLYGYFRALHALRKLRLAVSERDCNAEVLVVCLRHFILAGCKLFALQFDNNGILVKRQPF